MLCCLNVSFTLIVLASVTSTFSCVQVLTCVSCFSLTTTWGIITTASVLLLPGRPWYVVLSVIDPVYWLIRLLVTNWTCDVMYVSTGRIPRCGAAAPTPPPILPPQPPPTPSSPGLPSPPPPPATAAWGSAPSLQRQAASTATPRFRFQPGKFLMLFYREEVPPILVFAICLSIEMIILQFVVKMSTIQTWSEIMSS